MLVERQRLSWHDVRAGERLFSSQRDLLQEIYEALAWFRAFPLRLLQHLAVLIEPSGVGQRTKYRKNRAGVTRHFGYLSVV